MTERVPKGNHLATCAGLWPALPAGVIPVMRWKATFARMLETARNLCATRLVMMHIEEPDGLSFDDLQALSERFQQEGLRVVFEYDIMFVDVQESVVSGPQSQRSPRGTGAAGTPTVACPT